MIHKNIKLLLIALILAVATWQFTDGHIGNGIMLTLVASLIILIYFKNEFILAATFKLKKHDMDGAKAILERIKNPEGALTKKQHGYFNFLKGQFEYQESPLKAEKFLRKAIELGLNFDHDMAAAKMFLAGIAASKNRKIEANNLLSDAKLLDKHGMLTDQIKMMKQQMKRGQGQRQHYTAGQRRR